MQRLSSNIKLPTSTSQSGCPKRPRDEPIVHRPTHRHIHDSKNQQSPPTDISALPRSSPASPDVHRPRDRGDASRWTATPRGIWISLTPFGPVCTGLGFGAAREKIPTSFPESHVVHRSGCVCRSTATKMARTYGGRAEGPRVASRRSRRRQAVGIKARVSETQREGDARYVLQIAVGCSPGTLTRAARYRLPTAGIERTNNPRHQRMTSIALLPHERNTTTGYSSAVQTGQKMDVERMVCPARANERTCIAAMPARSRVCRWHGSLATARNACGVLRKKPTSPNVPPGKVRTEQIAKRWS